MTKGDQFNCKTDDYVIYTFTGKKVKGATIFQHDKAYQFTVEPKVKNSIKPMKVYKSQSWIDSYFVAIK